MPAPADAAVDEPSNFKVQTESAKPVRNTSLISSGTSSEMDELSSQEIELIDQQWLDF